MPILLTTEARVLEPHLHLLTIVSQVPSTVFVYYLILMDICWMNKRHLDLQSVRLANAGLRRLRV